jgi:hypothetical protein
VRRDRLGHPKIDDARRSLAIYFGYQNIRGFEIAVNYGLLMGVLHAFTHLDEQLEPFPDG